MHRVCKNMHRRPRRSHRIALGGKRYASCGRSRCEQFVAGQRSSATSTRTEPSAGEDACKRHLLHRRTSNTRALARIIPSNPRARAGWRDCCRGSRRHYAKAAGFETIAVSHSPDKDKMIRDLGADEVVRDGKGLAAAGGADVILSTSNSTKSMVDSIQGLRPDGRLVTMGADAEPLSVSLMDIISKRIRIIGSQQNGPEYLYEALDFVAQGKVKTIVETYPLIEAPKAYDRVAQGKARFRAVLTM